MFQFMYDEMYLQELSCITTEQILLQRTQMEISFRLLVYNLSRNI